MSTLSSDNKSLSARLRAALLRPRWLIIIIAVLLGVVIAGFLYVTRDTSPIPTAVAKDLTFSPLIIPTTSDVYKSSNFRTSRSEDDKTQLLLFTLRTTYADIDVSQYTQPVEFVDIPEYKDQFLSNIIQQYGTVQTANGVIYLGKLSKQDDKQIGVMLERGLIVFFNPVIELDEQQWRQLGDHLMLVTSTQ